jgi:MYXO-CTERM domain-containing protein
VRSRWLVVGAIATCLVALPARAHLGQVLVRAQRYLKIDASETDTRLVVSLSLGASEAMRVLAEADTDGDHVVSQAESDAYMAQWGETLATALPVEIDGDVARVEWTEGYMDPIGPVAPTPLTVEITAHLPVGGREHLVRVRDHMRREVFDLTEVAFRAHDGAELVASGAGESPTEVEHDLSFTAPAQTAPEVLTARLRYPSRSDAGAGRFVLPGVLALLAVAGLALWRRRARS